MPRLIDHARQRSNAWVFGIMLVAGALGLLAAFVLSVDAFTVAKNPNAVLSCSINIILNCATVMKDPSADLLGFPNSLLGLMSEPLVIMLALAGLAGVRFPRWFMAVAQVGFAGGFFFAYYLYGVSVFQIGALCPWCLLTTMATTLAFMSLLHFNIREDNLYLSPKHSAIAKSWIKKGYDRFFTAVLLAVVVFIILFKYHNGLFS